MYLLNPRYWFRQPHPLLIKNQQTFSEFNQSKSLAGYSFVALDTELTGLNPKDDEILSVGGVRIKDLRIELSDSYYQVVKPKKILHNDSTLIHQLSPTVLAKARRLDEVLPEFIDYIGDSLIIGHYIDLDMSFLNRATWKIMGGTLSNPGIDTMLLASGYQRSLLGFFQDSSTSFQSYKLEDLSRQYGLPAFASHNSYEDALQAACLFLYLVKKYRKGGLTTLKELYKAGNSLHY